MLSYEVELADGSMMMAGRARGYGVTLTITNPNDSSKGDKFIALTHEQAINVHYFLGEYLMKCIQEERELHGKLLP